MVQKQLTSRPSSSKYKEILARQKVSPDGELDELPERQRGKYLKSMSSGLDKPTTARRDPPRRRTRFDAVSSAAGSRRSPILPEITVAGDDETDVGDVPPSIWDVPDDLASVDAEQASDQGRAEPAGVNYAHERASPQPTPTPTPTPMPLPSATGGNAQGEHSAVEGDSAECTLENRPGGLNAPTEQVDFLGSTDFTAMMQEEPWLDDNYGNMEGFDFGELDLNIDIDQVLRDDGGMHRPHNPPIPQSMTECSSAADQTNFQPTALSGGAHDGSAGLEDTADLSAGPWSSTVTCTSDAPAQAPKPVRGDPKHMPTSSGPSGASVQPRPQENRPAGLKRPRKMTVEQAIAAQMKALTLLGWNPWTPVKAPTGV
ncbi:hypothetical protein FALBO_14384 [Fusarium albosuccineum]|uniref:Uncharacterized protein n=1 Tax=Fusarium albosuccineum TaxID=1237068 RepID=A0A8H4KZC3_9HYPO|nr:hypothetical protein FALBO_14384 [Fusarium albosuccineum]